MFCELDILREGHMILETWGYVNRNGTKIIRTYTRSKTTHDDMAERLFEDVLTADRKAGFCIISDRTTGEIVVTRLWKPVKGRTSLSTTWAGGGFLGAWRTGLTISAIEHQIVALQNAIKEAARRENEKE